MSEVDQQEISSLAIGDLRLAVTSDAAPERNGVGAYYEDLLDYLSTRLAHAEVFSPVIKDGQWQAPLAPLSTRGSRTHAKQCGGRRACTDAVQW